jgi:hypothetical protein
MAAGLGVSRFLNQCRCLVNESDNFSSSIFSSFCYEKLVTEARTVVKYRRRGTCAVRS